MPTQEGDGLIILLVVRSFLTPRAILKRTSEKSSTLRMAAIEMVLTKNLSHALNGGWDCCCATFCFFW